MFNMIKFEGEKNTQGKHSEAGDSQGSHCQISRERWWGKGFNQGRDGRSREETAELAAFDNRLDVAGWGDDTKVGGISSPASTLSHS